MKASALWTNIVKKCLIPRHQLNEKIWWTRIVAGPFSIVGLPDVFCCYFGRFIAAELKRDDEDKPRPAQSRIMEMIRRAGGIAGTVRSVDDFEALLNEARKGA